MMKINSIASQPDRVGRHLVRFDDGSQLRLYRQTVEDFGLFAGRELSVEEFRKLKENAGATSAKMRAVRILATTGVSKKDLEQRLIRKGETPDHARNAVEWMEDLSLIDDRKTAEQIVQRCIGKGYGMARAKQALFEKRIPKEYWQEVLADYPGPEQTFQLAMRMFREHPERRALFSGYLAKIGDDRALPEMIEAAQDPQVNYLTFIELRNAIEEMGGTCPEREFDEDPEYEALRGLDMT